VRDAVARYASPARAAGGGALGGGEGEDGAAAAAAARLPADWGVTRVLVAALEERGLLDAAFFAAAGPRGGRVHAPRAPGAGGAGDGADDDGDGAGGGGRAAALCDARQGERDRGE